MKIFTFAKKYNTMKKFICIFLAAFIIAFIAGSCNQKVCPAYSKANTEQAAKHV